MPVEHLCRLCGVANRAHDIAWAGKGSVVINVVLPTESNLEECHRYEFLHRVGDTRSNNEVIKLVALKHFPHSLDVIGSPAPITLDRQIAES
jgi:hypothetical protein